jgi:hypothetical protein
LLQHSHEEDWHSEKDFTIANQHKQPFLVCSQDSEIIAFDNRYPSWLEQSYITLIIHKEMWNMENTLGVIALIVVAGIILVALFEYRIRKPDDLVLHLTKGQIRLREGLVYPRHLSLPLKRTISPIQLNMEMTAAGNLGVNLKLVGSVAPSIDHIQSLVRVGGWSSDAVSRAAEEAQVILQGLVKEYTEHLEIQDLSSTKVLNFLYEQSSLIEEKLGVELISLAVQSLEPTDPEITLALRQQEQARLFEQTEQLNHQARAVAAKAKYQTDVDIAKMDHDLELKKAELNKILFEKETILAHQRLEDELARNRMRLAFEKEEVDVLKSSPELLLLTPQAARLAEASQNLKNARTVVSFTPQELTQGSELLSLFQELLQRVLEAKKGD